MSRQTAANILACVLMVTQLLAVLIIDEFKEWLPPIFTSTAGLLAFNQLAAVFIPTAVFVMVFSFITKMSVVSFLRLNPLSGKNIILIVLMSIVIQPLMGVMSFVSAMIFPNNISDIAIELFLDVPFAVMVVVMAVLPAIFEEVALRGAVLSAYGDKLGFKRTILINGIFFGMIHLNGQQLLYATVLGVFFSYLVISTNSLFASMISHFTINFSQILLASLLASLLESSGYNEMVSASEAAGTIAEVEPTAVLMGTVAFLLTIFYVSVSYLLFFRLLKKFEDTNKDTRQKKQAFLDSASPEQTFASVTEAEEEIASPGEIKQLVSAIKKNKRSTLFFYGSFFLAILIYLSFMVAVGINLQQIIFLSASFAVFFFVFFLFRVRG